MKPLEQIIEGIRSKGEALDQEYHQIASSLASAKAQNEQILAEIEKKRIGLWGKLKLASDRFEILGPGKDHYKVIISITEDGEPGQVTVRQLLSGKMVFATSYEEFIRENPEIEKGYLRALYNDGQKNLVFIGKKTSRRDGKRIIVLDREQAQLLEIEYNQRISPLLHPLRLEEQALVEGKEKTEEEMTKQKWKYDDLRRENQRLLESVGEIETRTDNPEVSKANTFYSLRVQGIPVLRFDGKGFVYLYSSRRDKPLKITPVDYELEYGKGREKEIRGSQRWGFRARASKMESAVNLMLEPGDFIDEEGNILGHESSEKAKEIFRKVEEGVEILPSPDEPSGYRVKGDGGKKNGKSQIRYRTWGQETISKLNPEKIVQGELLGSGGSYLAYVFGDRVAVEFDQEDRATYIFEKGYFDNLRSWTREAVRSSKPKGYIGRVLHTKEKEKWEDGLLDVLTKPVAA